MTSARALFSLLLVAILILVAVPARAEEPAAADAVLAALEAFAAHLNAGEWEAALEFYVEDERFYWVERGQIAYPSRDALAQAFLGLGEAIEDSNIELSDSRVVLLSEDYAYASARARQQMTFAGGQSIDFTGVMSILLVHTPEGWRFLSGHTSMEPPPGES